MFKVILGSFSAFVSKWPVSQKLGHRAKETEILRLGNTNNTYVGYI